GQVEDIVGFITDGVQIFKLSQAKEGAEKIDQTKLDERIKDAAIWADADSSAAIKGKEKAQRGANSGIGFAQNEKAQSMVEHAVNLVASF
ncbi:MAG: hypothetical protein RRY40_00265, partial [Oscillospiraceae bacterium]